MIRGRSSRKIYILFDYLLKHIYFHLIIYFLVMRWWYRPLVKARDHRLHTLLTRGSDRYKGDAALFWENLKDQKNTIEGTIKAEKTFEEIRIGEEEKYISEHSSFSSSFGFSRYGSSVSISLYCRINQIAASSPWHCIPSYHIPL